MKDIQNYQYFYISSNEQLYNILTLIHQTEIIALDTEFSRRTTYFPILSTIQIATTSKSKQKFVFVVDCFEEINLQEFFKVIANKNITKILHASLQDLQIFFHKSQQKPASIVDTQLMANFCDFSSTFAENFDFNVGYSTIVEKLFEKKIDKKEQLSNWQKRPLSEKQIEYAINDVLFLQEIYHLFLENLFSKNRQKWFFEEMESFVNSAINVNYEGLLAKMNLRGKSKLQILQIKNLIIEREKLARVFDIPRQHLLDNETIEKIVVEEKISKEFLSNINIKMVEKIREVLSNSTKNSEKIFVENSAFNNENFPVEESQKQLIQNIKNVILKIAKTENIKEQFLLSNSDIRKIINQKSCTKILNNWRYQLFGEEIEQKLISINKNPVKSFV